MADMLEATEQIKLFYEFFDRNYRAAISEQAQKGDTFLIIDFSMIAIASPELADLLLEQPEEVLRAAEIAIEQFDLPPNTPKFTVRVTNLPESQHIMVRNIRSKDLGKLLAFDGIVRQKSDVRPQVTQAKFECPSCGNVISVLQIDTKFKEPSRCGCGRKGKFRILQKELVDAQGLVLEEAPEHLEGGEQPKRMNVFLKNDLVSPISEKRTNPGQHIKLTGYVKEVPIITRQGNQSTRFDLLIEANYIESVEEDYSDIKISEEEEKEIIELSKDPKLATRLVKSVAPSIFGHDKIKEALIMQMLGGVKKERHDGTVTRGDFHVLLIGDPGAGKSVMLKRITVVAPKSRYVSGKGASGAGLCVSPNSSLLTNPGGMESIEQVVEDRMTKPEQYREDIWKQEEITDVKIQSMNDQLKIQSKKPKTIWKLKSPDLVYEVTLSSGKKIELTGNTQLFTINNDTPEWKKSMELTVGEFIATPRTLIGGDNSKQYIADLIQSNPVIHGIKPFVKEVVCKLAKKYGNIRLASKTLGIRENQLYHHWTNEKADGNIKLNDLKKICSSIGVDYKNKIRQVSLYNGKKHKLPELLCPDTLYFAGLVAGDGDISINNSTYSIRLSNKTEDLHAYFQKTLKQKFGLGFDIQKGNEKRPKATRTNSKLLGEILLSLGIPLSPKSNKIELSNTLLHLDNKLLSYYLAGLYDSDGSIICRNTKGSDTVEFYTCSEKLARQMQLTLLRYEMHACIRKRPPTKTKISGNYDRWAVIISGTRDLSQFFDNIPIKHPKKLRNIKRIIAKNKAPDTNTDVIPGVGNRIKEILQQKNIPLKKVGWHNNLSRDGLKKLSKYADEYKTLAESDIYWEKIIGINIKKPDYDFVYDLTVEDSHNFVVDGVLVHNTASVVKDEFLSGWSLEAGALVLANKGICMIDELDKMSIEDRSAMHEALEQQSVTISKANIQATLRAETTVLAAANPKLGRFDPYETLARQIDLPATLINRFDLIFPIRDMPDEEKDTRMANFLLELHKDPTGHMPEIPTHMLRKYISYAKQKIKPKLTEAAITELREYYIKMRGSGTEEGRMKSIPISARQLEGLIRLSEASSKMRLSQKVEKKDAKRAIDLLHYCLSQVGMDPETGQIDIDRISTGVGTSERSKIVTVREVIHELEKTVGKTIPIEDIVQDALTRGMDEDAVDEAIERLKRSGDIFEPKSGFIQRI